ncbi:MAG: YbdD/YjiX family protein [Gemmatimonadetes bacterium]|nr:YbdD/YjiX family protein [Gemmatimonadota bacterium]
MIQTAQGTSNATATECAAPQSRFARAIALVRRIIGAPDYEKYCAHMAATHTGEPVMTEREFVEARLTDRYSKPGAARCC